MTSISSPFQCNRSDRPKVIAGHATGGYAFWGPYSDTTWSDCIRRAAFSCAMTSAPSRAKASLPPVWSSCQCVFTTTLTGGDRNAASAVRTLDVMAAYSSSTSSVPSGPVETAMLLP